MHRPYGTTLNDLAALGQELAEEHLTLAAGGLRPNTYIRTYERVSGDVAPDYYA